MDPATLQLEMEPGRGLVAIRDGERVPVSLRPCFPWRQPGKFLSLRDADGEEIALIRDPADLPDASRAALEAEWAHAGHVSRIDRILSVKKELELRAWRVEVGGTTRRFQTALDEWPRELPTGQFLIQDILGDLYLSPPPDELDESSQRLLWALIG